jgi:hypothetical protein
MNRFPRIIACGVAIFLASANPFSAEAASTWTLVDGTTVEADFIRVTSKDAVILKLPAGDERHIPLDQLVPGDQARAQRLTALDKASPPTSVPATSNFSAAAVPRDQVKNDPDPDHTPLTAAVAKKIQAAVAAGNTIDVRPVRVGPNSEFFRDLPADGGVLIGFDVSLSSTSIQGLYPLFLTSKGKVNGRRHGYYVEKKLHLEAKPGYAVGRIQMCGPAIKAFQLTYMKLTPRGLDPRDAYDSPVYGFPSDGMPSTVGDGSPIVGVHGACARSSYISRLGIVVLR